MLLKLTILFSCDVPKVQRASHPSWQERENTIGGTRHASSTILTPTLDQAGSMHAQRRVER